MKQLFCLFAIVLMSITIASEQQYREVIHLNNGSVTKGTIKEQVPNETYKIETSDGSQFVYSWSAAMMFLLCLLEMFVSSPRR